MLKVNSGLFERKVCVVRSSSKDGYPLPQKVHTSISSVEKAKHINLRAVNVSQCFCIRFGVSGVVIWSS
jgi:hypothetical protein